MRVYEYPRDEKAMQFCEEYVTHSDHLAALAERDAEIANLRHELNGRIEAQPEELAEARRQEREACHAKIATAIADEHEAGYRRGASEMRERCAKVALSPQYFSASLEDIAAAIRALGDEP